MLSDSAHCPTKDGFDSPLKSEIESESKPLVFKLPLNRFSELDTSTDRRAAAFKQRAKELGVDECKTLRFGFVDEKVSGKKRKSEMQLDSDRKPSRYAAALDDEREVEEAQGFLSEEELVAAGRTILPLKKSSEAELDV